MAAHTQARLILDAETARPGETVQAGVHLRMDPEWHTYWKNSGASGIPTGIKWSLPPGITAGDIEWPVPEKLPPDDFATYAYETEVVLLVPLKLATDLKSGPQELKAKVSWLECKEQCLPGSAEISATLTIGSEAKASAEGTLIKQWQDRLPQSHDDPSGRIAAWWEKPAEGGTRSLLFVNADEAGDFFPAASENFEVLGATEKVTGEGGQARLRKFVHKFSGDWPNEISGLLVWEHNGQRAGREVKLVIGDKAAAVVLPNQPLWLILIEAFIGGLILNVMPCVLPVIALKILGFVKESGSDPRHVRWLGLAYTGGVLASFLAFAIVAIGFKKAGQQAGWGMQFSNPLFVVGFTVLVTLVALNLFGLFEVTLSGLVMNKTGSLAGKSGGGGAFFNGVLATVLATPCTAPFFGAALAYISLASTTPTTIIAVLLTAGAGLAAPYLLLSWQPAWLKHLPKPGLWMERFKIFMGFPMLATAVWLFSVATSFYGDRTWWLGVFLVFVGMAAWLFGTFVQRGTKHRGLASVVVITALAMGYVWALESGLRLREPINDSDSVALTPSTQQNKESIWQNWTPEAIAKAQAEGRPVLVDFTAKWCVTCNAIVKPAIENPKVQKRLKDLNAAALLADYTRRPMEMTRELNQVGSGAVPLVLVYPGKPQAPPIVLPVPGPLTLPSHYSDIVLAALDRAVQTN